ncbi:Uncharacterized conserved protein [Janthinobacterium sp. Marseille]|nr:zf-HC2 domain-containing protein [Janthinobacterium sp. Marseille]ABR91802.1 Uncharacterized conserved protein [Janthinobacterium sp. Marseille]
MGLPTCKEVHQLASARLDRPLSMVETLRMRMHLLVCDACRGFNAQLGILRNAMRQMPLIDPTEKKEK